MPFQVAIVAGTTDHPVGTRCVTGSLHDLVADGMFAADIIDEHTVRSYEAAARLRDFLAGLNSSITYGVLAVGDDAANDTDDDGDENICDDCCRDCGEQGSPWCDECGEHGHDIDSHEWFYCARCDFQCGVPDCSDCVSYGYDGDLCQYCAEDEAGERGSPGLPTRTRSCCGSRDVHHDDITERFLCDCQARRRIADGFPVTLAHVLPTLEVA